MEMNLETSINNINYILYMQEQEEKHKESAKLNVKIKKDLDEEQTTQSKK